MTNKRKGDPSLARIISIILVVGVVVLGVVRFAQWFDDKFIAGTIADAAPESMRKAKDNIAQDNIDEARKLLQPIIGHVKDDVLTPQALMLLAEAERKAGNTPKTLELLKQAAYDFPASPERPRAAVAYGRLLEELGRFDEAGTVYGEVRAFARAELRAPAVTGLGRLAERDGKQVEARALYAQAVADAEWDSDAWNEALDALGRLNVHLIFAPSETPDSKTYVVEPGDVLNTIGMKLNTTQGLLMRANGLDDSSKLYPGQRVKYTPKDFKIVIERSTCRLFLVDKDGVFKRYSVGLGMPGHETALGSYKIGSKTKDPTWFKVGEGPLPPGDPGNELGTRWMPLIPDAGDLPNDLGLHGTTKPETVGTFASMGCARLLREEIEELYDLVVRSTPVEIVERVEPKSLG